MSTALTAAVISFPALACAMGHAADVAIVKGEYLAAQQPGERSGMETFGENVAKALDLAGVGWEETTDSAVEKEAALDKFRVAIFPHNGSSLPGGEIEAVRRFMDGGGKVILFYGLPAPLAERIGIKTTGYLGGDENRDKFDVVRFGAPAVTGLPATMKQGSWNITTFEPTEGGAQVIGTWVDSAGADTGLPAVALSDSGAVMNHVLLNSGPDAARFLLAMIGHWFPDVWESAVDQALANSERFGDFESTQDLVDFTQALGATAGTRRMTEAIASAQTVREEARSLAADGHWPDALERLSTVPGILGGAYARLYPPRTGEMRAVWIHSPFNVADWDVACRHLRQCGFNAVIVNMCNAAIAYYPSRYLRQHDRALEEGDQILRVLKACRENGIELHVWRVNWNTGGNAQRVEEIQAKGLNAVSRDGTPATWLCPSQPENRRHEIDTMLEIAEKYDVDGIHFDYIRYSNSNYCYCDHCRQAFEAETGQPVENWPADVLEGDRREAYLAFRREQINVVVREVSERAHRMKPWMKVSAAVFGEWPASRISIGQDAKLWVDEGWLDFVCPMDYTNDTSYLRRLTEAQVKAVDGQCPLYIGIGAWRHESLATLVDQIQAARSLGADGFVLFAYESGRTQEFISALGEGLTRGQTYTPHWAPKASFTLPEGDFPDRGRAFAAGKEIETEVTLTAESRIPGELKSVSARLILETTAGQRLRSIARLSTDETVTRTVRVRVPEGASRLTLVGTMERAKGGKLPFVHRSARLVGLSADEVAAMRAESEPPRPEGEGIKVGVTSGGYGTGALVEALDAQPGLVAFELNRLTPDFLAVCDVVVAAQFKSPAGFPKAYQEALTAWVREGGRVMLMHDAVGYREHPALFPEIGRGVDTSGEREVVYRVPNPIMPDAGAVGHGGARHSYYDHINLQPGPDGTVVVFEVQRKDGQPVVGVSGAEGGDPVVVVGRVGRGKVVLNGMVTGLAEGDREVAPEGGELEVLLRAVEWLAAK